MTATLAGPDGSTQTLAADSEPPGVHTLQWAGTTVAGTPAPEGNWTFQVDRRRRPGQDDARRPRAFSLNETLGSLQVTPAAAHIAAGTTAATATFQLVHAATVTATVETRTGIVIATLTSSKLQPGAQQLPWDGRSGDGKLAFTGAYQVHVVATNSIGTVSLTAPFTAAAVVDSPPVLASVSSSFTSQVATHGAYAVFVLMMVDAVFPAASELVMLYAGAVAAGAFSSGAGITASSASRSATASARTS